MNRSAQRSMLCSNVEEWNAWRLANPSVAIDLTGADLAKVELHGANLSGTVMRGVQMKDGVAIRCDFTDADCTGAIFSGGVFRGCKCNNANFSKASLKHAHLGGCHFRRASLAFSSLKNAQVDKCNFTEALLSKASPGGCSVVRSTFKRVDLSNVDMCRTVLCDVDLSQADLSRSRVFGVSAWRLHVDENTRIQDLVITADGEPEITVDDITVAHFVDLLLHSASLRSILRTMTSKAVLVLGRFNDEGMARISMVREHLRAMGYAPIVFDFAPLSNRTLAETVRTLAHVARFIVVDMTEPRCVPHELASIVPMLPSVPVLGLLQRDAEAWAMLESIEAYPWFTGLLQFSTEQELATTMSGAIRDGPEAWLVRNANARTM